MATGTASNTQGNTASFPTGVNTTTCSVEGTSDSNEFYTSGNNGVIVYGNDGDDIIDARLGSGNNWLIGGNGNDRLFGKSFDILLGGNGNDILDVSSDDSDFGASYGDDDDDDDSFAYSSSGFDSGGDDDDDDDDDDDGTASKVRNYVFGENGDDVLVLGSFNFASGGSGDDTFYFNGRGNNYAWGDSGYDTFWLVNNKLPERKNYIFDFDISDDTLAIARVGVTKVSDLTFQKDDGNTLIKVEGETVAELVGFDRVHALKRHGNFEFVPLREVASLDGSGNNSAHPSLGQADTAYSRVAPANYADDASEIAEGPNARYVSNRIFNDSDQNLFSENGVTQWAGYWGQFIDHTFGLRQDGGENLPIEFDTADPLEDFQNDLGVLSFERSAAVAGTGDTTPREQLNTVSSYIDGWAIYGGSEERLDWLREGSVDGDPTNNSASLLLEDNYLPRANTRGDAASAPTMELQGALRATPEKAAIAGDIRANENIGLTSIHTLFAREHNRIVDRLPDYLNEEIKFQVARRVVTAQQQYITYNEFLPAMGVTLDPYHGYDATVDPSLSNEFATVGYRAHSLIHGEFEIATDASRYSAETLADFEAIGIEVEAEGDEVEIAIPLNIAFGNPDLVPDVGLDLILAGMAGEAQYKNDEQIDNQLRSVLFQIPTGNGGELDGPGLSESFTTVQDLGALDIMRARDHGIPLYNDLREAYGLERVESFTDITGEDTEEFPDGLGIDDPDSLTFTELRDRDGNLIEFGSDAADGEAVAGTRKTTLAARLKAIYGSVDKVDTFVGMVSEVHLPGSEFGELQQAMWKEQFEDLRDGDRFFYLNDPDLAAIEHRYGITYQHSLADIVTMNTDLTSNDIQPNIFYIPESPVNA
ncbi:MAG: peroxidase family protein [Leptolyngbyaceae cyanobacterium]